MKLHGIFHFAVSLHHKGNLPLTVYSIYEKWKCIAILQLPANCQLQYIKVMEWQRPNSICLIGPFWNVQLQPSPNYYLCHKLSNDINNVLVWCLTLTEIRKTTGAYGTLHSSTKPYSCWSHSYGFTWGEE